MPFGAALSLHPVTAHAVGEVAGEVLEAVGAAPDLATLFVTAPHAGALEDAAGAVRAILNPRVLVGCAAESVLANGQEVEEDAAVVLWAGNVGQVTPVRLTADIYGDDPRIDGWPDIDFDPSALLLVADPFSFPPEGLFAGMAEQWPGLPVVGGNASAARGPGGNRLVLDGAVHTDGAVGALLGPAAAPDAVVSQGCRPIGSPYVVTRAERNIVYEMGGQPPFERLQELATSGLPPRDVELINQGLLLGLVIDERKVEFGPGDFVVRGVMGADRSNGAIAVGDIVEVGTTAQYHVRDARTADHELRQLLRGRRADGALAFTCNGRGTRLFSTPNHDAAVIDELLRRPPTAGFFAAGEFGPIGGRNFVHGHTAAVALFQNPPEG